MRERRRFADAHYFLLRYVDRRQDMRNISPSMPCLLLPLDIFFSYM